MAAVTNANQREDYWQGAQIQDWTTLVSFRPKMYYRPQSMADLRNFIQAVSDGIFNQRSLRVLGGLHSCSKICENEVIVDVEDIPRTLEFNPDNTEVTVSANWHFFEFLRALSEKGKSNSATGGTDRQTLAGIISTNTAPATPHHTIYELVNWIEYITIDPATGKAVERRVKRDEAEFAAVVGSLGAMGVITRVNMDVIDQLFFETVQKITKLDEMLGDMVETSRKYDFWRIDWIPDTNEGLVWTAKRIPSADPLGDYPVDQSQNILDGVFRLLDKFTAAGPLLDTPMRLLYGVLKATYGEVVARGPLRYMLPVDHYTPLHVAMAEWSFDPAEVQRVLALCRGYFERNGWPNLPIEIELTKTDNYFMSPWNWPGLDYILKFNFMYLTEIINTDEEKALMMDHLRGLWRHFEQAGLAFKAHWGKINFLSPQDVRRMHDFERFHPHIREIFLNDYLRERFPER